MQESISINDVFAILIRRWKLIIVVTLITVMIGASLTYFVLKPVYEASTQILVNQKDSDRLDPNQLRSNIDLINTYTEIIKSPAILEKVVKELKLSFSRADLNKKIKISSQNNSQVFSLTVEDGNPVRAALIANTITKTFQKDIKEIMNVNNVSILAEAEIDEEPIPVSPKPLLNIAIALFIGLSVGMGLALLLEYLDRTLKDGQDVEDYLGLPVLGSIQHISRQKEQIVTATKRKIGVERVET